MPLGSALIVILSQGPWNRAWARGDSVCRHQHIQGKPLVLGSHLGKVLLKHSTKEFAWVVNVHVCPQDSSKFEGFNTIGAI